MKYTIIGAGIGGLATALAFEQKDIPYQIFESASKLTEIGAGIWLAPNALQVLKTFGVVEEVIQKGNSIDRIILGKADLSPLLDTYQDTIKNNFGFTTVAIHRAKLQKLLVEKIPQEKLHLGKKFVSFKKLDSGKINILFDDKSNFETDYLIGADGINSTLRKQMFPNSIIRYSGQTCWRGVANLKLDKEFEHSAFELWGNQIRFGFSKIAIDRVYWFAVALAKPNSKEESTLNQEKLLKMFSKFHPLLEEIITSTPKTLIKQNDINDVSRLKKWHKNNVCLIGDAAHACTPNMGQGGAQAIEDAYYLSNLIQDNSNKNIFEIFQQKRKMKVDSIIKQSWSMGKIAHWKYGKNLRNFLLKNIPKKYLAKKIMNMYLIEERSTN